MTIMVRKRMNKITIELTDEEIEGLQEECRRQEVEDGIEHISIEEQAASAVRFLLMELYAQQKQADLKRQEVNI